MSAQKSCFLRKKYGSWKRSAATIALAEYTITTPAESSTTAAPKSQTSGVRDRKSTRLNSSHQIISYAVFCLKKKINLYFTSLVAPDGTRDYVTQSVRAGPVSR